MANRAILTAAAICTATLAQADTFAERWPAPMAVCTENLIRVDDVIESPKLAP
jgi:hypothetical protein